VTVLAQEGGVDDDAVNGSLEVGREVEGLGKVVKDKLGEDAEAVVVLEEDDILGLRLVLLRIRVLTHAFSYDARGGRGAEGRLSINGVIPKDS